MGFFVVVPFFTVLVSSFVLAVLLPCCTLMRIKMFVIRIIDDDNKQEEKEKFVSAVHGSRNNPGV